MAMPVKIDNSQIVQIKNLLSQGHNRTEISKILGVHRATLWRFLKKNDLKKIDLLEVLEAEKGGEGNKSSSSSLPDNLSNKAGVKKKKEEVKKNDESVKQNISKEDNQEDKQDYSQMLKDFELEMESNEPWKFI